MAHRTEKEETTEFKNKVHETAPTPLSLCINNCGVTGNPSTNNMCQNCFNSITSTTTATSFSSTKPSTTPFSPQQPNKTKTNKRDSTTLTDLDSAPLKKIVNRCFGCRRKVGLTGFRCRCGELFCAEHRYSDRHECSFDYKAAGREAIKRENPVVKAPKIVRV